MNELLTFAREIAESAGKITLQYFQKDILTEHKADGSPVTIADRETEQWIRAEISRHYPTHGIIGEEGGEKHSTAEYTWVIDPIDGTKSFVTGIPFYTVLIALLKDDKPILGVIHAPAMQQTVWAAEGTGTFCNGQRVQVRTERNMTEALFLTTDPAVLFQQHAQFTQRIFQSVGLCRTWADAYGYLLLATGKADIVIDPLMELWDVAALIPIVREAGGIITDVQGNASPITSNAIACSGPLLHERILSMLYT